MATDRQVQETITQCLSTMARYYEGGRTRYTTRLMIAEVQAHAARVMELGLSTDETVERILSPVEAALVVRYGHELGRRFNAEFLDAFESLRIFAESRLQPMRLDDFGT